MKSIKSLVAALAAVTLVGAASAQTVVRITGSTAYRNATEDAVKLILSPGYVWGGVGKLIGGTQLIFSGTLATTGNAPVIILTSFTGSEGGIYNLYNPSTPPANATYIAHDAAHLALLTGAGYTGFTEAADATDLTAADIALADTFQNASPFGKAGSLVDTKVGIVAFSWFGAPNNDSITNITAHQAQAALSGQATYALWNNASADRDVKVHVVGRDPDSGTRDNTLLETGAGVLAAVQQFTGIGVAYTYNTSTSAFSAGYSGDTLYPAETVNGSSLAAGQGGFSSGGSVAALVADQTINAVMTSSATSVRLTPCPSWFPRPTRAMCWFRSRGKVLLTPPPDRRSSRPLSTRAPSPPASTPSGPTSTCSSRPRRSAPPV